MVNNMEITNLDRKVRLLNKTKRGWQIVLTVPASKMPEAEAFAMRGFDLDPTTRWKFEETSGKLIRDSLYLRFKDMPLP